MAINSALAGQPLIALGDALGSNVVNVALILAVTLLIVPITVPRDAVKRDFPAALVIPVLTAALLFDGALSRIDGLLLLLLFSGWLIAVTLEARRQGSAASQVLGEQNLMRALLAGGTGLALLVLAGRLIVSGATGIASAHGFDAFLIGATLVALGTSVPEFATAVISALKGHEEVGLGTILGSNVFNGLLIVGVASTISPIEINASEVAPALVVGVVSLALTYPPPSGLIGRWRGLMLLSIYAAYIVTMMQWR